MLIDNIIAQIDEGGPRSYYSFETFILNLLKFHLESQQKELSIVENFRDGIGDAIAPNGFDEFEGNTLIEIKFSIDRMPVRHLLDKFFHRRSTQNFEKEFDRLLIVHAKPVSPKWKERFRKELSMVDCPVPIILFGPEEINKIVSKHRGKTNEIVNNLFSLRIKTAVSKQKIDWKKERESRIEIIKDHYRGGQFSLFLGAGVSSSAGLPDWTTLLNSLFVSYLTDEFNNEVSISEKDIEEIVNRLNKIDASSALMAARYLRKGLSKDKGEVSEFTKVISENLYKLRNTKFSIDSHLIKSIVNLCVPKRTGAKIKAVVTYNFDDLVERQLDNQSIQYQSIYTDSESYGPDELPVYHVHGFLPENQKKYASLDKSTLVFSEEGYHHIYSNAYHWSNLVQLNNLRENHCLMIGLSMTDPNLRRLLDISGRHTEKTKHFAFMKRLSKQEFIFDQVETPVVNNIAGAEKFLERHHNLNEEIMRELGVSIIWYESYEDIPEILNSIKDY